MEDFNPSELRSALIYIKSRFGPEEFVKKGRLAALVSDLAPNLKNERVMIDRLSRLGIVEEIVYGSNADVSTKRQIISKSLARLTQQEYIKPNIAVSYLQIFTSVFEWDISVEMPDEEDNERKDRKDKKPFSVFLTVICILIVCIYLSSRGGSDTSVSKEQNLKLNSEASEKNTIVENTEENQEYNEKDNSPDAQQPVIPDHTEPSIKMSAIIEVSASSSLAEYGMVHSPERLIDRDVTKGWVEGVDGLGHGEWVRFKFDDTYAISGITISQGYQESRDMFEKNAKPSHLRVSCDGFSEEIYLKNEMSAQTFKFSEIVYSDSLTVEIIDAYNGTKYEDTVISEILFF